MVAFVWGGLYLVCHGLLGTGCHGFAWGGFTFRGCSSGQDLDEGSVGGWLAGLARIFVFGFHLVLLVLFWP